jgi:hypothetical protein
MDTLYTDEMLGSIKRFMNAYTKASMSKAEYKSAANDQITPFIILVDNFITPGDFSNCSDLQDVGTIDAALPKIRTASGEQSGSVRG